MKPCFTVDMEDWYHGLGLSEQVSSKLERRIKIGHDKLLNALAKHRVKATYFLLGKVIEEFPELIDEIKKEGHELGCHCYSHRFLYTLTLADFTDEIVKCKELIKPFQDGFDSFRAPHFSIDQRNLQMLEIIRKHGFRYDSSIFPGNTFRTGIPGFRKNIQTLPDGLKEFPITNFKVFNFDFGTGGAYFRILPYPYFRRRFKRLLDRQHVVFYFHPWELDEKQPCISGLSGRTVYPHYFNLDAAKIKLEQLLADFEFFSLKEIIENEKSNF